MKRFIFLLLFLTSFILISGQEYERNIMIEVFTNSHCPLCPAAHSTIDSYLANSPNAPRIRYMYYHMSYPYPDDQLYQDNPSDASGRNQIYGPYSSTPRAFFDGDIQSNTYDQWANRIDNRLSMNSLIKIDLSGNIDGSQININSNIEMNSNLTGDLVFHLVVVEDVEYSGRNGIKNHKNVVRDMITSTSGVSISISSQQEISKSFSLSDKFIPSNVSFIVFIQNESTLEIHQAAEISYSELLSTGINEDPVNYSFSLEQNYPNPFNPTTKINFSIPSGKTQLSTLVVYNILGQMVKTLVNRVLQEGSHSINFDASDLPSGIYFYQLSTGSKTQTKKMQLIK